MTVFQQLENAPYFGLYGFNIVNLSGTSFKVLPGICRDSTNSIDLSTSGNTDLDLTKSGVLNSLDTGALSASESYYIYVIGNSGSNPSSPPVSPNTNLYPDTPTGCLVSLSSSSPILPGGYDVFRRIGYLHTDAISVPIKSLSEGSSTDKQSYYILSGGSIDTTRILAAGNATTFTTVINPFAPYVGSLLGGGVTGTPVVLECLFTPAAAGNSFGLQTTPGTQSAYPMTFVGPVISQAAYFYPTMFFTRDSGLQYKVTSASDSLTIRVVAYTDYL